MLMSTTFMLGLPEVSHRTRPKDTAWHHGSGLGIPNPGGPPRPSQPLHPLLQDMEA